MKKIDIVLASLTLLGLPGVILAQFNQTQQPFLPAGNITSLWFVIIAILNFIWPIFIGFAIIMLLLAGFLFLTAQGEPSKVKEARFAVIWGVVGIIVGILAFSIPFIVRNQLAQ